MYAFILAVVIIFSFVSVGGTLPKSDPYPKDNPVEVTLNKVTPAPTDGKNSLQLFTFSGTPILPTPSCPVGGNVDVMLVLDYSGSTEGDKLTKEKGAANTFIDTLARNPQNRVGFAVFNDTGRLVSGLTKDFTSVKQQISKLPDGEGWTCIKCGLELANSHMASNGRPGIPQIIVLLSDGYANRPEPEATAFQLTRDAVTNGHQQTKITYYPIGFSGDLDPNNKWMRGRTGTGLAGDQGVDEPFMRELASLGGGTYYYAPTNADLESVLRNLGVSLICQDTHQQSSSTVQPIVATPVPNP